MCFNRKPPAPVAEAKHELTYTLGKIPRGYNSERSEIHHTHIKQKVDLAKQQLGVRKRALHCVTKKPKLLVFTTLCRPLVESPRQYGTLSSSTKFMTLKWFSTMQSGLYVTCERQGQHICSA